MGIFSGIFKRVIDAMTSPSVTYLIWEPFFRSVVRRENACFLDLKKVSKLLVVRLDEIGDVVMTTPLLRELRGNLPNARISVVVNPRLYNLLETCPYVDDVWTYDWRVHGRLVGLKRHWRALYLALKRLWWKRYDLAILPRWDTDYYHGSYVAYFSGASLRIGYSGKVNPNKERSDQEKDILFSHVLTNTDIKHEVERNIDIIRFLGGHVIHDKTELWLTNEDEIVARNILDECAIVPGVDEVVAFCPGAGYPKRRWPLKNFIDLGRELNKSRSIRILIIGGPGEGHYGESLVENLGEKVVNLAGKLTLRQTAAILKKCDLYIGNDTGPKHLAAAVGTPVVEISQHPVNGPPQHPNSPIRFGPWGVPFVVVQPEKAISPCKDSCTAAEAHCICNVTVEQVKEAVLLLTTNNKSGECRPASIGPKC